MSKIEEIFIQDGLVPGGRYTFINKKEKIDKKTGNVKKPKVFVCPSKEMKMVKLDYRDVIIDIGAYTGLYTLMCAKYPVKKVYSYEATKSTFNVLYKNCEKLNNIECFNKAVVGDDKKYIDFYISKSMGVTNSIKSKSSYENIEKVECVKYSNIIKNGTIVKIDIEGGEYDIPIEELIQPHIRAYLIDFHKVKNYDWLNHCKKIIERLDNLGYKCLVKPNFDNGWTRAGAWILENYIFNNDDIFDITNICQGCHCKCNESLCKECNNLWSKKHKKLLKKK